MKVLIFGSGSYVIGDKYGPGVVLRSVIQWLKMANFDADIRPQILLTYTNAKTHDAKQSQVTEINSSLLPKRRAVDINLIDNQEGLEQLKMGKVDACFVCVPDEFHAHYIDVCIASDAPVWVVKPLTGNLRQANVLASGVENNAARIWVDYHKRFDASNIQLKALKNKGDMGTLLTYSVDYHQPRDLPIQVFDWSDDVDVFTYIGCHYVDQIFFLFPEAKLVSLSAEPVKGEVYKETGQFDGVMAQMKFDTDGGPLVVQMNVGWFNPLGSPVKSLQVVKAQFERGLVDLDQTRRGVSIWRDNGVTEVNPYFFSETQNIYEETIYSGYGYDSVCAFMDLVHSGEKWPDNTSLPNVHSSLKTEQVLSKIQDELKAI